MTLTNLDDLLEALSKASVIRNVLCHGSWRSPDDQVDLFLCSLMLDPLIADKVGQQPGADGRM